LPIVGCRRLPEDRDAGPRDAGPRDAGTSDAGPRDAGTFDAGPPDTGCGASCPCLGAPALTPCRPASGPCDAEERCDGTSALCPPDAFERSTVQCRPSSGPCDVAETCSGGSSDCPADTFLAGGTVCDPSIGGPCDLADVCTGSSASCPPRFQPSSTVCRASGSGEPACDPAEVCTGSSAGCPSDVVSSDGSSCNTGRCGFESCSAGRCTGGITCPAGRSCRCGGEVCLSASEVCP
jgi:hypothetical protein